MKIGLIKLFIANAHKIGTVTKRDMILSPNMYDEMLPEDRNPNFNRVRLVVVVLCGIFGEREFFDCFSTDFFK